MISLLPRFVSKARVNVNLILWRLADCHLINRIGKEINHLVK